MSGALHPALVPLLAGGGAPERLAVASGELRDRMETLLWAPSPRLLDNDVLAPLTAPLEPGDTLEAVLARLAGDAVETTAYAVHPQPGGVTPGEPMRPGPAASLPLPADIAAHARALARPPAVTSTDRAGRAGAQGSATPLPGRAAFAKARTGPVSDLVATATSHQPRPGDRRSAQLGGDRDWQVEAAQLGADRPLRIVAEPPQPAISVIGRAKVDGGLPPRDASPSFASDDAGADGPTSASEPRDAPPVARAFGPRIAGGLGSGPLRERALPTATGAIRDGVRETATTGPAETRPRLHAVTMPQGAPVGGFAGLAALGRAASPERPAAVPEPRPVPLRASEVAARVAGPSDDRATPTNAQMVIAELTDVLRLQILAAGIDLSGRRP